MQPGDMPDTFSRHGRPGKGNWPSTLHTTPSGRAAVCGLVQEPLQPMETVELNRVYRAASGMHRLKSKQVIHYR